MQVKTILLPGPYARLAFSFARSPYYKQWWMDYYPRHHFALAETTGPEQRKH